jgi:hypothetical protein
MESAVAEIPEEEVRSILQAMIEHWKDAGLALAPGTVGYLSGGFGYSVSGSRISVWSVALKPTGAEVNLNLDKVAKVSTEGATQMAKKILDHPGLSEALKRESLEVAIGRRPRIQLLAASKYEGAKDALVGAIAAAVSPAVET